MIYKLTINMVYNIKINKLLLPNYNNIHYWIKNLFEVYKKKSIKKINLTIYFANKKEMQNLNYIYKNKNCITNILSFPFKIFKLNNVLLGDLIINPDSIIREANIQNKKLMDHYAHIIIHGVLHLLNFNHITNNEKIEMENLECKILKKIGINNPYI